MAILALVTAGCAGNTSHGIVEGSVTMDGAPLQNGLIRFVPIDGQSPTADAIINDGKFSAKVPVGEKRVSISASKVVGKRRAYETPDSPTVDVVEELVPKRYNIQSELTMNVAPGRQREDFELRGSAR